MEEEDRGGCDCCGWKAKEGAREGAHGHELWERRKAEEEGTQAYSLYHISKLLPTRCHVGQNQSTCRNHCHVSLKLKWNGLKGLKRTVLIV